MKNKIIMLSQAPFPPDIRLEKEIRSLAKEGFQITVVCNQYDRTKNLEFEYCDISKIRALFQSVKLNRIFNFPIFFNPRYLFAVFRTLMNVKPDFIHAHDLPMMPIAILFGKLFRLPVIFDMHENYPEALKYFDKKGILNFLFKNYHLAKILERICLKYSDRIIVVVEENKQRLINMSVSPSNIYVVSNTVDPSTFERENLQNAKVDFMNENRPVIIYTGIVSPDRGLLTAIKSAFHYQKLGINPLIVIVGDGMYKKFLVEFVEENRLSENIKFIDWPGHENISFYISKADACIIPQPGNDFINTTIPHKLFEYMLMGKPILVSDSIPLKRIVEETNSGLVFKSNNPLDFAEKVNELSYSKIPFGMNGLNAVKTKYNWQREAQILIDMYMDLSNRLN